MKILFVLANAEYIRNYGSTIELLAQRGHTVLLTKNREAESKLARLEDLASRSERIHVTETVPDRSDMWSAIALHLRGIVDFVRYLHPRYESAPLLRERMARRGLGRPFKFLNRRRTWPPEIVDRAIQFLLLLESAIPSCRSIEQFLKRSGADIVFVTPLTDVASAQVDIVKSAQKLKIPTVVGVASWDNLTNKGHLRVVPDLLTVWNERQRDEAINLHGIPADRVSVTGAQLFDHWFEREPSRQRDEFCALVRLDSSRPIILFVGSSQFIAQPELELAFVRSWIRALRDAPYLQLQEAQVLIRPHPYNVGAWATIERCDIEGAAIWPRGQVNVASEDHLTDYFDSVSHSAAVVGVNTSAMIEAAIIGRPVLTILAPEFNGTQRGTLHFQYLLPEQGGFVQVASSLSEHLVQLAHVLEDNPGAAQRHRDFVATFLRPRGINVACTPILADAIEGAAYRGDGASPLTRLARRALTAALTPVAALSKSIRTWNQRDIAS